MTMIDALNQQFGREGQITFRQGPGELPVVELKAETGRSVVALQGAHVLEYIPAGTEPVLWLSEESGFERDKPIRGGIPVCWPWFGPHPTHENRPAHGFVRIREWKVTHTAADNTSAEITLTLKQDGATRLLWPHEFELQMRVRLAERLEVSLHVCNTGAQAFEYTGALHSYFSVGSVSDIQIFGLEGCEYIDKMDFGARKKQEGTIRFRGETDRVYVGTESDCLIVDPVFARRIRIAKQGSRSTVVWNPWKDKAARMPDFGDEEYPAMVCVETANAADDAVLIAPGGEHRLSAFLSVE
jgi:D-hexose-6-phosphate mutarotase